MLTGDKNSYSRWVAVTPADGSDLSKIGGKFPRGLYTGAGGDIAVENPDGDSETFASAAAGVVLPIENVSRVLATGTTATGILALYW